MTLGDMAVEYRRSAWLLRERIRQLKEAEKTAEAEEKSGLERRIKDLTVLCRETGETAWLLEHYYDRRGRHGRR